MKIFSSAILILSSLAPVFPLPAEDAPPDVQAVFLHNGKEYPPQLLDDLEESGALPEELSLPIESADTLGWRRFENGSLQETMAGAVAKNGKVALPNGVEFSTAEMTVFQCLLKLRSIYYTFHSTDFGYPDSRGPRPPEKSR